MAIHYLKTTPTKPIFSTGAKITDDIKYGLFPGFLTVTPNRIDVRIEHGITLWVQNDCCSFSVENEYIWEEENIGVIFSEKASLTVFLKKNETQSKLCELFLVSYGHLLTSFRENTKDTTFYSAPIPIQTKNDFERRYFGLFQSQN